MLVPLDLAISIVAELGSTAALKVIATSRAITDTVMAGGGPTFGGTVWVEPSVLINERATANAPRR